MSDALALTEEIGTHIVAILLFRSNLPQLQIITWSGSFIFASLCIRIKGKTSSHYSATPLNLSPHVLSFEGTSQEVLQLNVFSQHQSSGRAGEEPCSL